MGKRKFIQSSDSEQSGCEDLYITTFKELKRAGLYDCKIVITNQNTMDGYIQLKETEPYTKTSLSQLQILINEQRRSKKYYTSVEVDVDKIINDIRIKCYNPNPEFYHLQDYEKLVYDQDVYGYVIYNTTTNKKEKLKHAIKNKIIIT